MSPAPNSSCKSQSRPLRLRHNRLAGLARFAAWISLFLSLGCGVQVYDFGGGGRGTQFHVPAKAAMNPDPVVQSWIAYSLAKSTCQLQIGGELPSENSSFKCELRPREVLVKRWATRNQVDGPATTPSPIASPTITPRPSPTPTSTLSGPTAADEQDEYLDLLVRVQEANFLEEYVWFYFRERDWPQPDWLELGEFESWRTQNLGWHRPETRFIGYWITPSS